MHLLPDHSDILFSDLYNYYVLFKHGYAFSRLVHLVYENDKYMHALIIQGPKMFRSLYHQTISVIIMH